MMVSEQESGQSLAWSGGSSLKEALSRAQNEEGPEIMQREVGGRAFPGRQSAGHRVRGAECGRTAGLFSEQEKVHWEWDLGWSFLECLPHTHTHHRSGPAAA